MHRPHRPVEGRDPPLEEVVARGILKSLRPTERWETVAERTRALCLDAARAAIGSVRFVDQLRARGRRLEGDPPAG